MLQISPMWSLTLGLKLFKEDIHSNNFKEVLFLEREFLGNSLQSRESSQGSLYTYLVVIQGVTLPQIFQNVKIYHYYLFYFIYFYISTANSDTILK